MWLNLRLLPSQKLVVEEGVKEVDLRSVSAAAFQLLLAHVKKLSKLVHYLIIDPACLVQVFEGQVCFGLQSLLWRLFHELLKASQGLFSCCLEYTMSADTHRKAGVKSLQGLKW